MNAKIALFFVLFVSIPLARSAPITSVTLSYDRNSAGEWVAHLTNMSHKNITVLDLGITATYKDGTTGESEHGFGWEDQAPFAPGMAIDKPLGGFDNAETVKIVVDVVVYSDLTAEVTNDRAFQAMLQQRKEVVLAMQKVNEVISNAPTPKAAADELERLASTVPANREDAGLHISPTTLRIAATQIRQGRDPNEIVKQNNADIAKHDSEITKIN